MLWLFLATELACTSEKTAAEEQIPLGDAANLVDYVDPFIATGGIGYAVNCGFPGAGMPFGMVKISPDTAMSGGLAAGFYRGGGYHYDDTQIQGFSHTHLYATGITGHAALATMPTDGMSLEKTTRSGYGEEFSHDREWATPGRYAVELESSNVELSATEHTSLHEYQFTEASTPTILIDVAHVMGTGSVSNSSIILSEDGLSFQGELIMDGEMGAPYPLYFYGELDQPALAWGVWNGEELFDGEREATQLDNMPIGAWLEFAPESTVGMRIAISNIDLEGALYNFAEEHTGFVVSADQENAKEIWAEWLDVIQVWGGTEEERRIFATALYHQLQMPTLFSDSDGRYRGFDGEIHQSERNFYTDFSLWDTYRTTHPLYTLLWPEAHSDLLWSLSRMAQEGGGLPRWPLANLDANVMLGTSVNIVFPEAIRKGISDFEEDALYQLALDSMMQRSTLSFGAPPDLELYEEKGYYPADLIGRSVAWTQEQSIADYALGELALDRGDTSDGEHLIERGMNWKNLWDPEIEFFHGRDSDGEFTELSSEENWEEEYAEGNARQYLWLTPHDPVGLFEALGGMERSLERLEEMFFEMERTEALPGLPELWYWHGNEPTLHVPWLFALAGNKERGDYWIDWLRKNRYSDQPDGLAGNDDGGTLSAWYVFASLGFYPMAGTTEYVLGEPIWTQAIFSVNGQDITNSKQESNDSSIQIGQENWTSNSFQHAQFDDITFYAQ